VSISCSCPKRTTDSWPLNERPRTTSADEKNSSSCMQYGYAIVHTFSSLVLASSLPFPPDTSSPPYVVVSSVSWARRQWKRRDRRCEKSHLAAAPANRGRRRPRGGSFPAQSRQRCEEVGRFSVRQTPEIISRLIPVGSRDDWPRSLARRHARASVSPDISRRERPLLVDGGGFSGPRWLRSGERCYLVVVWKFPRRRGTDDGRRFSGLIRLLPFPCRNEMSFLRSSREKPLQGKLGTIFRSFPLANHF